MSLEMTSDRFGIVVLDMILADSVILNAS